MSNDARSFFDQVLACPPAIAMSFVTYPLDLPDACRFHEHLLRTGHKMLRAAKHGTLAISAPQWLFFVPVLILCYLVRRQLVRHPSAPPDARETCLAALSSVVIPSRDARKLSSIPHTVDLRSRTITLCSSRIIKGILDDSIELRNPIATLTALMQDRYETKGWNIRLNVEGSSMKIVFWLLKNQFIFEVNSSSPPNRASNQASRRHTPRRQVDKSFFLMIY